MKTTSSKTFSLDNELFESFVDYCKKNSFNRSSIVQNLIYEWMMVQEGLLKKEVTTVKK